MRILSKCVVVPKPVEDIKRIILTSAFIFSKPKFVSNTFSIWVGRRYRCRDRFFIPIKGTVLEADDKTKIVLEVHAEASIVISGILILAGVVGLLWSYVYSAEGWFIFLMPILMGILVSLQFICEGKDVLDQLEEKLRR